MRKYLLLLLLPLFFILTSCSSNIDRIRNTANDLFEVKPVDESELIHIVCYYDIPGNVENKVKKLCEKINSVLGKEYDKTLYNQTIKNEKSCTVYCWDTDGIGLMLYVSDDTNNAYILYMLVNDFK